MRRISNPKSFLVLMVAMMTLVDAKHIPRMRGRRYKGHPGRDKSPLTPESGSPGVIEALNTSEVVATTPSVQQVTANSSEPAQAPAEDVPVGTTGTGGGDAAGAVIFGDHEATSGEEEAPVAGGGAGAFNPVARVVDDRKVTHREEASSARGGGDGEGFDGLLECEPIGPCVACGDDELDYPYCAATGRRVEVRCTTANADQAADMGFEQRARPGGRANAAGAEGGMASMRGSATFRSCAKTEQEEIQELVRFWLAMLALGVVSCIFIRRRQRKGISLYDRRAK